MTVAVVCVAAFVAAVVVAAKVTTSDDELPACATRRLVNAETHDANRMYVQRVLYRARRRTMRLDGGPAAKVHRMRTCKRRMPRS